MKSKQLKDKKCKWCKLTYTPKMPLQQMCSMLCAINYGNEKKKKAFNKEHKAAKESLLTHKDYIQLLQKVFNTYIRFRDKGNLCISCDTPMANRKGDASHYYPTTYQYLRFNELNVHLACVTCNQFKHGNIQEYTPRIEKKIGVDNLQWLHAHRHDRLTLSVPEIKEKIKEYKNKIALLK
jgi:hypothetical protein